MRLSVLLTAGSCGILLVACSRKPKPPGEVVLTNDAALVAAVSSLPVGPPMTSAPEKVTVAGGATASPAAGGGSSVGAVAPTTGTAMPVAASTEQAQEPLVPVNPSADSETWLGATAPAGASHNALFTPVTPVVETSSGGSTVFSTRAVGIGASVIGLGALMDAGGAWSGGSSSYTGDPGFGQVFVEALGLAFNGYRAGGSLFGLTWSAPASSYFAPLILGILRLVLRRRQYGLGLLGLGQPVLWRWRPFARRGFGLLQPAQDQQRSRLGQSA